MNILEFFRRNSILVLVVIFGVGAGLIMMDYSGKTSALSRNSFIVVNGHGYSSQEAGVLGSNGLEFLKSLIHATRQRMEQFDTNEDGTFSQQEIAALHAECPDIEESFAQLNSLYRIWSYGPSNKDFYNAAINRAILHAEGEHLGLKPSEEQIDAFLRAMPAFRMADGSFNHTLYKRIVGYRGDNPNRVQEEMFRAVVADIILWQAVHSYWASGVNFNTAMQSAMIDASEQSVTGRTAWLPADKVPAPAEPTEDELKAFWEQHKEQYKSPERRIVSVYTLTPAAESSVENLLYAIDFLMEDLTRANGHGLDKLLSDTARNPEFDEFSYTLEDGSTHVSYELSTQGELAERVTQVNAEGTETSLATAAFSEISGAPTVAQYEAAKAAGDPEKNLSIKQIRGPFTTSDGKVVLVRVEAVEAPEVLEYDAARENALADMKVELNTNALANFAEKLYQDMETAAQGEGGLTAAFELAEQSGATVESFGPQTLDSLGSMLPAGVTNRDVMSTPSGKLTPLCLLDNGARISAVVRRTIETSPAKTAQRNMMLLPNLNEQLRSALMQEWINAAYSRFQVTLSDDVPTAADNHE